MPSFTPKRPDQMSTIAELGQLPQPYLNWGYCLDFQVCILILKSNMAWRDSGMAMSDILHSVLDLSQPADVFKGRRNNILDQPALVKAKTMTKRKIHNLRLAG